MSLTPFSLSTIQLSYIYWMVVKITKQIRFFLKGHSYYILCMTSPPMSCKCVLREKKVPISVFFPQLAKQFFFSSDISKKKTCRHLSYVEYSASRIQWRRCNETAFISFQEQTPLSLTTQTKVQCIQCILDVHWQYTHNP